MFELLAFLLRHPGQVFSREQLLEQVWGYDYAGETRTVDVHVHWLRTAIEPDPAAPTLDPDGPRRRLRLPPPDLKAAAVARPASRPAAPGAGRYWCLAAIRSMTSAASSAASIVSSRTL